MTSDIGLSGAGCTIAVTPNQLVQSSSENNSAAFSARLLANDGLREALVCFVFRFLR
jgi:hypothetical protein